MLARRSLLVSVLVALAACSADVEKNEPIERPRGLGTSDAEMLRVWDLAPSFGGFYLDSAGYVLVVTDLGTRMAVKRAAASVIGVPSNRPLRFVSRRNSYGRLASLRDSLFGHVLSRATGGTSIGIDQVRNVVRIGAESDTAVAKVLDWAARLRIPARDIMVVREERAIAR
jgi:hypothetical protein